MPFDQATLDAIAASAPDPTGGPEMHPTHAPPDDDAPAFYASWRVAGLVKAEGTGDTAGDALDDLLANLQDPSRVDQQERLKIAQSEEASFKAPYDAAKAERETIEAER